MLERTTAVGWKLNIKAKLNPDWWVKYGRRRGSCINVVTDPENSQTSQLLPLRQEMGVSIVGEVNLARANH